VSRFESLTKRTIFTYSGKPSWRWQQAALCSPHALCSLLLQRRHKFWLATPAVMDPSAFSLATSGFTCPFYLLSCDECAQSLWVLFRRCFFALPCLQVWTSEKCGAAYFKWRRSGKLVDYHSASSLKENVHMSGILLPRMTPTGAFKRGANRAYACVTSTWMDLLKDGTFGAPMGYSSEIGEYKYERWIYVCIYYIGTILLLA
jgi:hypothetical protein